MTRKNVPAEFVSAHLEGSTGAALEAQWLDAYNGQQRVTGLNRYVETPPKTTVADIMAITALLGKEPDMQQPRRTAAPKPRLH